MSSYRLLKRAWIISSDTESTKYYERGYLVHKEDDHYRGEDGTKFKASQIENNLDWFFPVTQKTIEKLDL